MTGTAPRRSAALALAAACLAGALLYGATRHAAADPVPSAGYAFGGKVYPADKLRDLLASDAYRRHFDEVHARTGVAGIAGRSPCQADGRWRYRPGDPLRPFRTDMDWTAPPGVDGNWSWHHHGLAILDCPLGRFLANPRDKAPLRDIRALVADWMRDNHTASPANPHFSWGDHTTPRRLRKVIYLFAILQHRNALVPAFQQELVDFVRIHTDRLLRDPAVIRRHHNHALDQVHALALSQAFFPFLDYRGFDLAEEIRSRFAVERDYLVADDGVQTENSPAYHMWVTSRIATMEQTFRLYAGARGRDRALDRNNRSLAFATWIQRPDRTLPQIGDTAPGKRARIRLPGQSALPSYGKFLYAQSAGERGTPPKGHFRVFRDSGYLVYRDDWRPPLSDDTHLVMACGFEAEGHRHSDDGTITLTARGQDWLVDTGMYGYEAGPHRLHALSPKAHNISYLPGVVPIRDMDSERYRAHADEWGLSSLRRIAQGHVAATCTSFMYPRSRYTREVDIQGNRIVLEDAFRLGQGAPVPATRFNIPRDKRVAVAPDGRVDICTDEGDCIRIRFDPRQVAAWRVIEGVPGQADAFRTRRYLEAEPIQVLELAWEPGVARARFQIALSPADIGRSGADRVMASP